MTATSQHVSLSETYSLVWLAASSTGRFLRILKAILCAGSSLGRLIRRYASSKRAVLLSKPKTLGQLISSIATQFTVYVRTNTSQRAERLAFSEYDPIVSNGKCFCVQN